ncbi:MAG: DMT family transporter [Acidobacteriota bacterium]
MTKADKFKGILLAVISSVCVSLVYITSRIVQQTMPTDLFILWWFAFASIWALVILIIKRKDFSCYIGKVKEFRLFFLYFIISETFGAFFFFYVIKFVNPSIVSFVGSITPLFVAIIAFFYINEKLSLREITGGIISVSGVILITYVSPDIPVKYTLLILSVVVVYSFNNVLIKKKTKDIPPILITLVRIFFLFLTFLAYKISSGLIRLPNQNELFFLFLGSLLGPILGMFALFSSLKFIKSTQVSLIKNSQPFLVVLFSYFFLKTTITNEQLLAGTLIIIGISLMISDKRLNLRAILNRFVKN